MELAPLGELLLFESLTDAGVKVLKQVKTVLSGSTQPREIKHLVDFAQRFASDICFFFQSPFIFCSPISTISIIWLIAFFPN